MSKASSAKSNEPVKQVGKSIIFALTQDEVALLLDSLLANISQELLKISLNGLPIDTQKTLWQILSTDR